MASKKLEIEIGARDTASPVIKGVANDMAAIGPAATKAQGAADGALDSMYKRGTKASEAAKSISEQLALMQKAYVALQATQGVQALASDLAATADAYNNLQARIKLATGEGEAFNTAFDQVSAIAQRTSSNLESTGNLFAKLAEAGKSAGLGTQAAIAQALSLTETVNQAVQLSGASAQASDAAITQLIQGLQGGVLRGDEFNSVMEQSPRLAKALADGLGTTTGELRKMAEAGQLSSETVIKALQGQADTVASEFSKLPPTVGRALENLSTSWTLYVGETDKATGASSAAAKVIGGLANNLSTIAGYLIDAGQAATAFAALKLAQHFTGIATAATSSAVAVAANTTAMTAAGAAGSAAAVSVGRFASILSGLKTFTLLGLITNFNDIGVAIGEGAAKLMGFKDRTQELAAAEKTAALIAADTVAQRQRMATATQAAIDKQFELGKAGQSAIAEFDKLTKAGSTAAEAIAKIGKDFDLSTVPGIQNATAVLDKLAADGRLSAGEFQQAWSDALKGADLGVFEVQARAAFAGTARETERLAQVLDATLRESIKRTGLDFAVISGGMGAASRSAINDTDAMIGGLDRLKAMGVDTAQALTASLGKGISTADSQAAIEAVRLQIEAVRKVLGDKITDGLLDQAKTKADELKDALDKATPGITSVREAMKQLGVVSDQTFKDTAEKSKAAYETMRNSGTASARELAEGFKRYATDAIAANGGVATEALKVDAAMRGLEIITDKAGKTMVRAQSEGRDAIEETNGSLGRQREAVDDVTSALEIQNAAQERANAAKEKATELENKRKGVDSSGFSVNEKGERQVIDMVPSFNSVAEADAYKAAEDDRRTKAGNSGGGQFAMAERSIYESEFKAERDYAANKELAERTKKATDAGFGFTQARQLAQNYAIQQGNGGTGMSFDELLTKTKSPASSTPTAPTGSATPAKTYTVNVNLGGTSTAINTSSDADAQALIRLLQSSKLSSGL